jgi:hypothetical protein
MSANVSINLNSLGDQHHIQIKYGKEVKTHSMFPKIFFWLRTGWEDGVEWVLIRGFMPADWFQQLRNCSRGKKSFILLSDLRNWQCRLFKKMMKKDRLR